MKSMKSAKEYYTPPPKGKHPATITLAEATFSKKGASMIHFTSTLEGAFAGEQVEDWAITDGSAKGGGFGKAKLRGLGVNVETDADVPDEQIANSLIGRKIFVEIDHEPSMRKNEAGELVASTHFDSETGQTIALQRAVAKGYSPFNVGGAPQAQAQAQAPQMMQAPQYAPPPFGQMQYPSQPPQYANQPQQFAPQQPQYVPQPVQYPGQPPQYTQAQPAQQIQQTQPLPVATAPWAQPTNGALPAQEETKPKRGRPMKVTDV